MSRGLGVLRVVVILVGGAVALWVSIGVTLNLTIARLQPAPSASWWPVGVTAKVTRGRELLTTAAQQPVTDIDPVRASLRDAALREPVNTQALGTLAALDELRNDTRRARALFRASETVSRRNVLTQFWLIEDAVARGDVAEAIKHYNRAMLVSSEARTTLLPVLAQASSDPAIRKELLPLLAKRPLWWKDYLQQLGTSGADPTAMALALAATRTDIRNPDERGLAQAILRRMVALKDGRGALRAANRLERVPGSTRSIREGDFETADGLVPFAWWMRDEDSIRAFRDTVPDGGMGLRIETSSGASGGVAQQLIGLAAGRYIMQGRAGDVSTDQTARPTINVTCETGKPLSRFSLPSAGPNGRSFRFAFDVPATDCALQWVTIVTAPAVDTNIWLDNLTATR